MGNLPETCCSGQRVLILGAGGQLGRLVAKISPVQTKVSAYSSSVCDITDRKQLQQVLQLSNPDLVINCAAYTKVDLAETHREKAFAVNAEGPRNLAELTGPDVKLVHVSTDFVFGGETSASHEPLQPDSPTAPLGVYGSSKLAGEQALLQIAKERSVIVRTAWVYAAEGNNFLNTMLRLMTERDELEIVNDQIGTPTAAHNLAKALWQLADKLKAQHGEGNSRPVWGTVQKSEAQDPARTAKVSKQQHILHWTDAGQATWFEFAQAIREQALASGILKQAALLKPIESSAYPTAAKRPSYSVLDKTLAEEKLGYSPQEWEQALYDVLRMRRRLMNKIIG
jgi:dTDP-4-dehydrorhamnose reductase